MIFYAELPKIDEILGQFARDGYDYKHARAALRVVAMRGISAWQEILSKPHQKHARYFTQKYASGLQILGEQNRSIRFGPSRSTEPFASVIERGRGRYRIWEGMAKSPRLRRGKKGAYMIIAFRHGMAQVEQHGLKEEFSGLKSYNKTGTKTERNAHGNNVQRNTYSYSSEGFGKQINVAGRAGFTPRPGHKSHIMQGLTKATQKTKGGGSHTSAVTFRVITARSPGWMFPAISPWNVRKQVIDRMIADPEYLNILREGIARDMQESKGL